METDATWMDDPCFDDMGEMIDGRLFTGDDWRQLMRIKEQASNLKIVAVVGTTFRADAIHSAKRKRGTSATLHPEPDNPHDPKAVKVIVDKHHVGYIPRAKRISPDSRVHVCKWGADPPYVWIAVES